MTDERRLARSESEPSRNTWVCPKYGEATQTPCSDCTCLTGSTPRSATETPRVDAESKLNGVREDGIEYVRADFARQLERDFYDAMHGAEKLYEQLKAARSSTAEPYGFVWFDKNMEQRFSHKLPHPESRDQPVAEPVRVYREPVSATASSREDETRG